MSPKTSWKDVIEGRQKESFVGRKDYIKQFTDNFASDIPNYLLFFVIGEGGVGKSTLLKQFESIGKAPEIDAIVIICDDEQSSPVAAMGYIAEQLTKFDINSKEFNERYKTYRTRRDEIESDLKAPRGALNLVVRGMTDFAIKAARRTPGVGVFAEYVDEKEAGEALSQGVNYLIERIGNKDEVQLLREPEKTLSPLFIELLNKACEEHRVVLMFDVFERTREALEPWLLEFLDFKFGEFDTGITFVISGRDTVDQRWTQIASSICYITLEPFTLEETRSYLRLRKITNKQLVTQIFEDTAGLPVLVELLAGTNPKPGSPLPDISKDAVKRFLQWIPEEERRWVALLAAVPRKFNLDILSAVLNRDAHNDFNWLSVQSYIRTSAVHGWFYHEKVRELMMRYLRKTNPSDLAEAHKRLADFFEKEQKKMGVNGEAAFGSESWRNLEIERVYHLGCENPVNNFGQIINSFLESFHWKWGFAESLLQINKQSVSETASGELKKSINVFSKFYKAFEEDNFDDLLAQANILFQHVDILGKGAQAALSCRRGEAFYRLGRFEDALKDFDSAVTLDENFDIAYASRGYCYFRLNKYEPALVDLDRAIELDKNYHWAHEIRGVVLRAEQRYEEAIDSLTQAKKTGKTCHTCIVERGKTYLQMEKFEQALADFDEAIGLKRDSAWVYANRGDAYHRMKEYELAITDYNHAIKIDDKYTWALVNRGEIYESIGDNEKALADFDRVIELDNQNHWAHEHRGVVQGRLGNFEEAIISLSQAEKYDLNCPVCVTERGDIYRKTRKHQQALDDFNRAIALNEKYYVAFERRGETYLQMGEIEMAIEDFSRAIAKNEKYLRAFIHRSAAFRFIGDYKNAIVDFNALISLDENKSSHWANRGDLFWEIGDLEKALNDFNKATELDKDSHWAYERKSLILRSMNRLQEALDALSEAEISNNKCSECISARGELQRRIGNTEAALTNFNLSLELDKGGNSFELSRRAAIYHSLGNILERDKDIKQVMELTGEDAPMSYNKAVVYVLVNKYEDALDQLKSAITKNPTVRTYARHDDLFAPLMSYSEFQEMIKQPII